VADRISINLETTSSDRLGCIAGVKDYEENRQKAPHFSGGMNAVLRQSYYTLERIKP